MSARRDFLTVPRRTSPYRPVPVRVADQRELIVPLPLATVAAQAGRCMDCGVPFCHHACPLGNLIPEWNDAARRQDWGDALEKLERTNSFPEFTGRLCPAPCEPACVLAIGDDPVSIKEVERTIIDTAFERGWIRPQPPSHRSGRTVAVVGSGPAGLAAAQRLNHFGHWVTVYERNDRLGGLLRYGIPDFKMERHVLDRRLDILSAEGVSFECGYDCGADISGEDLLARHDAVVVCVGAEAARDVDLPGRHLEGVHLAMEYLVEQNRAVAGDAGSPALTAAARHVVIIGGGDTAADCLGDAHRERCASVQQLVIYPQPPRERPADNPWPRWPLVLRSYAAHEEGGTRAFGVEVIGFHDDGRGRVAGIDVVDVVRRPGSTGPRGLERVRGSERRLGCDMVLLAIGFSGVRDSPLYAQLAAPLSPWRTLAADAQLAAGPRVFVAGDAYRGAALVVDAVADGRHAAESCDRALSRAAAAATAV